MPTGLSIIIVNWNTRDMLAACLASIFRNPPDGAALEVIVVDNGSTDGSQALLAADFPQVRLIANRDNVGFAHANNQGLAIAQHDALLLLNSDTAVHPHTLTTLLAFLDHTPTAGAIGPQLLNADGSLQPSCTPMLTPGREFWRLLFLDRFWPRASYPLDQWQTEPRPVEVIKGACMLLRRAALADSGPLDERFFMYTEEVDLCYRLAQRGWDIWYLPAARVTHFGEASSRQVAEAMYVQLYRSKVQFYRKTGGARRARLFKLFTAVAYTPRLIAATIGSWAARDWQPRARTYRRLLLELPGM